MTSQPRRCVSVLLWPFSEPRATVHRRPSALDHCATMIGRPSGPRGGPGSATAPDPPRSVRTVRPSATSPPRIAPTSLCARRQRPRPMGRSPAAVRAGFPARRTAGSHWTHHAAWNRPRSTCGDVPTSPPQRVEVGHRVLRPAIPTRLVSSSQLDVEPCHRSALPRPVASDQRSHRHASLQRAEQRRCSILC